MSRNLALFCLIIAFALVADAAQYQPIALTHSLKSPRDIDRQVMSPVDVERYRAEDADREVRGLPPRFAIPIRVKITPNNAGRGND